MKTNENALERVIGVQSLNAASGAISGVKSTTTPPFGGYEAEKERKKNELPGDTGGDTVLNALRQLPVVRVRGLAIGALGEMGNGIHNLIAGLASEGSFNYKASNVLKKGRRMSLEA